jgi:serine/threonine protein kinase/tetratricopeptide (TPR) repeat protein
MPADPGRVKDLLATALDLTDPAARDAYLDRVCGTDPDLRRCLALLLQADDDPGTDLHRPVAPSTGGAHSSDPDGGGMGVRACGEGPGAVIAGRYRLLEKLGEGGMGEVWVAQQTEPVRRQVAVKLIKPGMDSRQVIARFEAERQALALMDHPNIAHVLDGGLTDAGRPFFVMELVNGPPLTRFCDEARLTPRERLGLFVPVCRAVQHAHQKGVIHRDLKPANILVTLADGKPVPKVIDFGVAKATGRKLTGRSVSTQFGAVVGTVEYMAPEQAGVSALDVDTRADIYSLGVVLYELLTGLRPFDPARLERAAFDEVLRIIREEEPPRPSTRLSADGALPPLAAARRTDPRRLTALMRGELDWVVMKCLEKARNRRYETAAGLAADVQRYLAGEAVQAVPPSVGYRVRKLLRRNRGPVAAVGSVLLAALAGAGVSVWQAVRATAAEARAVGERDRAVRAEAEATRQRDEAIEARARADEERAVAEAVKAFVTSDLLGMTNAWGPPRGDPRERGPEVTFRTLLGRAARRAGEQFADRPLVEAGIRRAIGDSYGAVGLQREALPQLERALELYRRHRGPDALETLAIARSVALHYLWYLGDAALAEPLAREALDGFRRTRGPDDRETIHMTASLADVLAARGRRDEAARLRTEAYARSLRLYGRDDGNTLTLQNGVVWMHLELGQYEAAEPLALDALARCLRAFGEAHPLTHVAARFLTELYLSTRRYDRAEPLAAEWLATARRVFGEDSTDTLWNTQYLARVYTSQGRNAEALPLLERLHAGRRQGLGADNHHTREAAGQLATCYARLGRLSDAIRVAEAAGLGGDPKPLYDLACVYALAAGQGACPAEQGRHARRAVALLRQATAKGWADPVRTVTDDMAALLGRDDYRVALAEVGQRSPAAYPAALAQLGSRLIGRRQFAAAESAVRECLALREQAEPNSWATFEAKSLLGGALLGLGKYAEAEPLLRAGYDGLKEREGEVPPAAKGRLAEAADRLVELYTALGKPDGAARWRTERGKYPAGQAAPRGASP